MAGDWIKMRGALLDNPKVIAMSRALHKDKDFREWLTPGGGGPMNEQLIGDTALRCVTTALLLKVWSVAREHGVFDGDDLVLRHNTIADIDQMCGVSGVGEAMESVGWAIYRDGLVLPNFIEFNVPMTNAEKQKEYRERKKAVTVPLLNRSNETGRIVTTREEKRRNKEEGKTTPPDGGPVWTECLTILTEQGNGEKTARSFLGMLCREYEEAEIIDAVKASVGKANATAYIRGVLKAKPKKGEMAQRLAV